jgi:hypothetical protein
VSDESQYFSAGYSAFRVNAALGERTLNCKSATRWELRHDSIVPPGRTSISKPTQHFVLGFYEADVVKSPPKKVFLKFFIHLGPESGDTPPVTELCCLIGHGARYEHRHNQAAKCSHSSSAERNRLKAEQRNKWQGPGLWAGRMPFMPALALESITPERYGSGLELKSLFWIESSPLV